MTSDRDFLTIGKCSVAGSDKDQFVGFLKRLNLSDIISKNADVVLFTEKCDYENYTARKAAMPFSEGLRSSKLPFQTILTYDPQNCKADFVGKNVRFGNGYTVFEMLTLGSIARVRIRDTGKKTVKYALLLACGLTLSGVPFEEIAAAFSPEV